MCDSTVKREIAHLYLKGYQIKIEKTLRKEAMKMRLATVINFDENGVDHPVWEEREETPAEKAAFNQVINLLAHMMLKYHDPNKTSASKLEE